MLNILYYSMDDSIMWGYLSYKYHSIITNTIKHLVIIDAINDSINTEE